MPLPASSFFVFVVLFLADLPAARLRVGRCFCHGSLRGWIQRIEGLQVDEYRVLGQPGLGVVPVLDVLIGLRVIARRARAHVAFDHPGGQRLTQLRGLNLHRLSADQFSDLCRGGAVGAPLDATQVRHRADLALAVDALGRPRHREQQLHALGAEQFVHGGLGRFIQLACIGIAGGEEGHAV
jgi:hypothetical protein